MPNPTWPILLFKICHTWSVYYGQLTQPGQSFFCLLYQRNSKAGSPKPAQGSHCPGGDKVDNRDMFWTYQLSFFLLFSIILICLLDLSVANLPFTTFSSVASSPQPFYLLLLLGALFVSNPLQGFINIPLLMSMCF